MRVPFQWIFSVSKVWFSRPEVDGLLKAWHEVFTDTANFGGLKTLCSHYPTGWSEKQIPKPVLLRHGAAVPALGLMLVFTSNYRAARTVLWEEGCRSTSSQDTFIAICTPAFSLHGREWPAAGNSERFSSVRSFP